MFIPNNHNVKTWNLRKLETASKFTEDIFATRLVNVALEQIIQLHLFLLAFVAAQHNLFGHLSVSFLDLPSSIYQEVFLATFQIFHQLTLLVLHSRDNCWCLKCKVAFGGNKRGHMFHFLTPNKSGASSKILTVLGQSQTQCTMSTNAVMRF